jgi:segregation and condensation protein A
MSAQAAQENYQLKLAVFEGPFDLLLYLIKKNQIDIYDIPIAKITEEYLAYIDMMKKLNLDIASEFIVIAATLIYIKSKMLLPKDEFVEDQEEDPRLDLVQHLIEYNTFKEISEKMRIFEARKRDLFERLYPINISAQDKELTLDMYALVKAMDEVLGRIKERRLILIPGETMKVKDRMYELIGLLKHSESVSFFSIVNENKSRLYVVSLFLAILELMRLRVINVYQEKIFDDIKIFLVQKDIDMEILNNIQE